MFISEIHAGQDTPPPKYFAPKVAKVGIYAVWVLPECYPTGYMCRLERCFSGSFIYVSPGA